MKRRRSVLLILACIFVIISCKPNKTYTESELALIPQPQKMVLGESSFRFKKSTRLVVESVEQKLIADYLSGIFEKATGWKLDILVGGNEGSNQVYFKTEPMLNPEAYTLEVLKNRIIIKAAQPAGFFYAVQTLRQLLPAEIESSPNAKDRKSVV